MDELGDENREKGGSKGYLFLPIMSLFLMSNTPLCAGRALTTYPQGVDEEEEEEGGGSD